MEKPKCCVLCGKEEFLYICNCGKFFCVYHHYLILHHCTYQYPICHRLDIIQKNDRCYVCKPKKKRSLLFRCHCDGMFCLKHRYPETHRCIFNHRSLEIERLKQILPLIVKDKVPNRI